jgi:hypothetical protein
MHRTDEQLMASALTAYCLSARHAGEKTGKPKVAIYSTKEQRRYVVLRDLGRVVVYRIRNDEKLKRWVDLRRLPEEIKLKLKLKL